MTLHIAIPTDAWLNLVRGAPGGDGDVYFNGRLTGSALDRPYARQHQRLRHGHHRPGGNSPDCLDDLRLWKAFTQAQVQQIPLR
ncbi:MAG: hypothetical protein IPM02_28055 [Betaproteobacteria bacterium]|nr:hypothetical protein [Betaproteobacteria bacterium]